MKKSKTEYYENFQIGWEYESLDIEKNEESDQRRIKFFQERWRNKKEWKELIEYLNDFIENCIE